MTERHTFFSIRRRAPLSTNLINTILLPEQFGAMFRNKQAELQPKESLHVFHEKSLPFFKITLCLKNIYSNYNTSRPTAVYTTSCLISQNTQCRGHGCL